MRRRPGTSAFSPASPGLDNPTSNDKTRAVLGWEPTHPGWVEDVQAGHYFGSGTPAPSTT